MIKINVMASNYFCGWCPHDFSLSGSEIGSNHEIRLAGPLALFWATQKFSVGHWKPKKKNSKSHKLRCVVRVHGFKDSHSYPFLNFDLLFYGLKTIREDAGNKRRSRLWVKNRRNRDKENCGGGKKSRWVIVLGAKRKSYKTRRIIFSV